MSEYELSKELRKSGYRAGEFIPKGRLLSLKPDKKIVLAQPTESLSDLIGVSIDSSKAGQAVLFSTGLVDIDMNEGSKAHLKYYPMPLFLGENGFLTLETPTAIGEVIQPAGLLMAEGKLLFRPEQKYII